MKSYHVGVSAEAFAAAMFARCECDVSVQYGANQPEYDLMISSLDKIVKVSVKGSQDGSWGLTQNFKNPENNYHDAIDLWLAKHSVKTIFCLVQFINCDLNTLPRIYLATPLEISSLMKMGAKGRGDTILYENKTWTKRSPAYGTIDKIPDPWIFSKSRLDYIMNTYG
ncbi:hypothetical protein PMSD_05005 [Paenibacillus macquariensis subsp. defensor]|nr:hypothetical protein PMSD_05005 [Paenibacillus macquariensis subsp. defensor]